MKAGDIVETDYGLQVLVHHSSIDTEGFTQNFPWLTVPLSPDSDYGDCSFSRFGEWEKHWKFVREADEVSLAVARWASRYITRLTLQSLRYHLRLEREETKLWIEDQKRIHGKWFTDILPEYFKPAVMPDITDEEITNFLAAMDEDNN